MARLVDARRRFGCLNELHTVRAVRESYSSTCFPGGVFRRSGELVTGIYLGCVSCCFGCFAPSCLSSWFLALRVWFARSQCRARLVIWGEWHTGLVSDRVHSSQLSHRFRPRIAQVLTIPIVFDRVARPFTRSREDGTDHLENWLHYSSTILRTLCSP